MIVKQLTWTLCWHAVDNFHLLSVFLHGSYYLIRKYIAFTTNLLKTLFFLKLLKFYFASLDNKKFTVLLCISVYHKGNPSVSRESEYQETTPRFTRLIPGNDCVQGEDIWVKPTFVMMEGNCESNPLPILKKHKRVIPKCQHLLLAKKHSEKTWQLNLAYKTMELQKSFWKKTNFETEHLRQSFDITRADIRKV